jgi:membrane protein implicated in regulation of membrane protease activity
MSALTWLLLTPLAGALLLLLLPPLHPWSRHLVGWLSLAVSALTLLRRALAHQRRGRDG